MLEVLRVDCRVTASILSLLLPSLTSCGDVGTSPARAWLAVYDTIGDTAVVRTVAGSIWNDTAELVPDFAIGEFQGPEECTFGDLQALAVATDGSIYVFDSHTVALRKYAPDGTYLATLGRQGGGPGEYKEPDGGLAVLADNRVLLRDPGNARIGVWSPDGRYLDSWRIRGQFNFAWGLYVDTAGNTYTPLVLNPQAAVNEWRVGLVWYGPDGMPGDTIAVPSFHHEPSQLLARGEVNGRRRTSVEKVPFMPSVSWTFSTLGYFVGGASTSYAVSLFKTTGQVLRIERGNWVPVPVLLEEKEEQERIISERMRLTQPNWVWNGDPIPSTKPAFLDLFVGERGRIWVQLYQQARKVEAEREMGEHLSAEAETQVWKEPVAFDVFEPDGRYLGMVRAPDGFSRRPHPVIRGDTVWAVVRGEFDVPYVSRFRIQHR